MRYLLQQPAHSDTSAARPLWLVLHGATGQAEQAVELFGCEAEVAGALLLAPQGSRPCGEGYCWSFARDTAAIVELLDTLEAQHPIDPRRITLIGFSMGCAIGCWLLADQPGRFQSLAALGMGSAFEPWELDDGGIDRARLAENPASTRVLLAVDRGDTAGCNTYFADNLARFTEAGFQVETYRPNQGTHAITPQIKRRVVRWLAQAEPRRERDVRPD